MPAWVLSNQHDWKNLYNVDKFLCTIKKKPSLQLKEPMHIARQNLAKVATGL